VIRNSGTLVGGSVAHPHLQMAHGGSPDGCLVRDRRFLAERGVGFGPWVAGTDAYVVRDYGDFAWVVPPFARRRLHCLIVPRRAGADFLYGLDEGGRCALATALGDFTRAVPRAMAKVGRPHAHNLVFHTGAIGGLYVEAIAPTQTVGGYEQAGMWINLQTPEDSARVFREALAETE
jgi:galactose-1-phosphate uridylyltransferase